MLWRHAVLALTLASGFMLAAAFGFEHLGGLPPCKLCWWQRYVFMAAAAVGIVAMALGRGTNGRVAAAGLGLLALTFTVGAGIAGYHVGVELGWWRGPEGCAAASLSGDFNAMFRDLMNTPVVRCDEVPWSLFGISMAGYNVIVSLALAGFAVWAAHKRMNSNH
ncbi:MAG: disulfide bond formation protein B [Sphingomonadales bacterium]